MRSRVGVPILAPWGVSGPAQHASASGVKSAIGAAFLLERLPAWTFGERACDKCQPRPHRVLMNFAYRDGWTVHFVANDCRTPISRYYKLPDLEALHRLATTGCVGRQRRHGVRDSSVVQRLAIPAPYRCAVSTPAQGTHRILKDPRRRSRIRDTARLSSFEIRSFGSATGRSARSKTSIGNRLTAKLPPNCK